MALFRRGELRAKHRRTSLAAGFVAVFIAAGACSAHLLSAGSGALNIRDNDMILLIALPVSVLTGADDNSDHLLQSHEIQRHRTVILAQLNQRFKLLIDGKPGTITDDELMVSLPVDNEGSTNQIEWWQRREWAEQINPAACIDLAADWFQVPPQQKGSETEYVIRIRQFMRETVVKLDKSTPRAMIGCESAN